LCGSWTLLPRPSAVAQAQIHDNSEYFEHPYFKLRRSMTRRHYQRCRDVFERLSTGVSIEALRGCRLLDIGCDTGNFLKAAQDQFGIIPVGVDVAQRAIEIAASRGIEAYPAGIEEAASALADFPVITAIDLIEHVPAPEALLRSVRTRVRPGGLIYLETPNICSAIFRFGQILSKLTGGRPHSLLERLFPPQHVQYFTTGSLGLLAKNAGFEIVRIGTRILPSADIAASWFVRLPISVLQAYDSLLNTESLIWAVLRRPATNT